MMTAKEAYDATNPDPAAYGLPADASAEDVQKRREDAAQNILAGAAANAAYWDSRPELEALRAQAEGHGVTTAPPTDTTDPTAGSIEGTATEEAAEVGSGTQPQPAPDNPLEAVAALRAQLEQAGIQPTA